MFILHDCKVGFRFISKLKIHIMQLLHVFTTCRLIIDIEIDKLRKKHNADTLQITETIVVIEH